MSKVYRVIVFISVSVLVFSCSGKAPLTIGEFRNCPDKPNCVSSKNIDVPNYMGPIYYKGSLNIAKVDLLLTIKTFDSAKIKKLSWHSLIHSNCFFRIISFNSSSVKFSIFISFGTLVYLYNLLCKPFHLTKPSPRTRNL